MIGFYDYTVILTYLSILSGTVTVHPDEVCAALSEAFECGMTITEAKGYYSDSPKTVVYIVVNRFQVGKMKELVHENDRSAYISIAEIADVYGANTDKV